MAVTITDEELDLFNKNGFTDDDVRATVENYRSQGLDDNAIRAKVQSKIDSWNTHQNVKQPINNAQGEVEEVSTQPVEEAPSPLLLSGEAKKFEFHPVDFTKSLGKGFVHGISSIGTGIGKRIANPIRRKLGKEELTDNEIENIYGKYLGLPEDKGAYKTGKVVGEIAPYFLLPEAKVAQLGTVGNATLTGAYQGALGSGLSSVAEKGFDAKENLKDIAIGTAVGGALGGIAGKVGSKLERMQRAKDIAKRRQTPLADRMTEAKPQVTQEVIEQPIQQIDDVIEETVPIQQVDEVVEPQQLSSDFNNTETDFIEQAKKQILENDLPSYDDAYIYSDNGHGYLRVQIENMRDVNDKYTKLLKNLEEQKNSYLAKAKSEKRIKEINEAYNQRVKEANDSFKNSQQNIIKNIDNYKKEIDIIPEQVVEVPQTGKMKQSKLAQKANKSDEVAQSIQENPPLYEAINNAETIAQAQSEIAQNADKVHTDIVKKLVDGDKDFSALDVEKTRQLFGELQKQGRFDEATELLELTSKQGSKLGQAVQAFSLWSKTTPDGAMLYAQKLLDKYNRGVRKNLQKRLSEKELRDIGETFQKLNESGLTGRELEVETAKAMKKVFKVVPKTFAQKLDGYRYINMLLSPQSRIKDFILTAKNASDTAIDESIAGGIDYLRTLGSKDKTRYISANPFAGTKAWLQGAKKGFKESLEDIRYGINTSRSGEVGRYGLPNTPTFKEANFEGGLLDRAKTLIGNPLGSAEKLLRYTLQVPDRMFFEARYASSLANQMKARGVTEPTQDMINRAVEEAKRAVFQEDRLVTKRLAEAAQLADIPIEALENVIGLPQGTLPSASKGLAPFVKTPTNVIAQGLEGLHGLGSGRLQLSKAGDNPELIREAELLMGRGIRGLGELGLGYAVGKGLWDKIKTNIGEEDYYKNEITGLQPSSLVIGDKAISLQNMQNNLPFFTGVGLGQRGLGKAFTNTTDIIAEMPALKALGDLYNINKEANYIAKSEDPDKELLKKGSRAARSLGANYLTTLIPVGGWLGELRTDIDPFARELYAPDRYDDGVLQGLGSDAEYLKNRVQNRIPGLSMLLPNRYNSLGQPIMSNNIQNPVARALSQAVNFGIRNYNEPPAEMDEMQRIQDYAMENNIQGKTTLKFAKPKRYIGRGKDKTRLTNEQYSELTRLYNGKVYDELQFLMNTPEYQSADEETKIKWVKEVMKEKKQEAEQEISDIIK